MTNVEFVKRVLEIADTNPTYRTRGDGSDGTCDCIGLIMGALGGKFDMHSTNWFCRYQLAIEPQPITDEEELQLGDLVIKARNEKNPRYDLHERYKPGGRYYTNGDLLDYYHVGVVTSTGPLVITHCTETGLINGIARDYTLVGWTHIGMVNDLEYEGEEPEEKPMEKMMMVVSLDGNPVKMRATPSTVLPYIEKVPNHELVTVHELGSEWATISWGGKRGYMMRAFLHELPEDKPQEPDGQAVTITLPMDAAQALYHALAEAMKI